MIPITTDTQRQLYKNVLENFEDDTARLVLADAIEEEGGSSAIAYAEFIRLQCKLSKAPPPRKVLKERAVVEGNSPDYFLVNGGHTLVGGGMLMSDCDPGDRIDIPKADVFWRYGDFRQIKTKSLYGLRFLKLMDDDGETVLVSDEHSGPDKWRKERKREKQLLKIWEPEWLKDTFLGNPPTLIPPPSPFPGFTWKRGLLYRVEVHDHVIITDGRYLYGWTGDLLREFPSIRELVPRNKQPLRTSIGGPWHWFADNSDYRGIITGFPFSAILPPVVYDRLQGKFSFWTREEAIVVLGETLRNWVVEENEGRDTKTAGQVGRRRTKS